jgi:RNA polymerase sigma-70 factor (ECF subfamily)
MAKRVSDAILVERFVRGHQEAAFIALVRRHGPVVERVCRRVLRCDHDVEDVFQATFLVLARKAANLSARDSLAGWLSAVARRLAMNVRSSTARMRTREITMTALLGTGQAGGDGRLPEHYHPVVEPPREIEERDLRRILDQELGMLPEKYRAPMVLCDLEGQTHEEAARQLGWPQGSMSRRLGRARMLLRQRLVRRGLALGLVAAIVAAAGILPAVQAVRRARVIRESMAVYRPLSEGGKGLGMVLGAIARAEEPAPGIDQILQLARAAVHTAESVEALDSGSSTEPWRNYAALLRRSAVDFDQAGRAGDPLALATAARRLDETCQKCHLAFRQ